MNLIEEHIAYLKDNPQGYWFKRKLYGFGWTPARKEGWLTLGVYVVFVLGIVCVTIKGHEELNSLALASIVGATVIFIAVVMKTGESPKWQWGEHDKQE